MTACAPDHPNAHNPFFQKWDTPFQVPPFEDLRPEHYLPAFQAGIRRHNDEVRAILKSHAAPTFQNTVEALEDSGEFLDRVTGVFTALVEADTSEALQTVALAVGPLLSSHQDDIWMNEALFRRVAAVHHQPPASLTPEARTLLEHTHRRFLRGGAGLGPEQQARLRAVHSELSLLCLRFEDNLLRETNAFRLLVEDEADLEGLPPPLVAAAREAADRADLDRGWVFTLHGPSLWPFLEHARNRDLRRALHGAFASRCGNGNAEDNNGVAGRIASLRCEKARLLGFRTYAHFALEDAMARDPAGVFRIMDQGWGPAVARARAEAAELQALLEDDLPGAVLEPWDWRHYASLLKRARHGLDTEALRPYFPLDRVQEGAFRTANHLFGITFNERADLPVYHPEVRTYLVQDRDGSYLGVYYTDWHPRPGKRGGAWMECFRRQCLREGRDRRPLVYNVANFPRPVGGRPALLDLEDVRTLFHEFGHALHALLARCRYRSLSGTATALDFSELPSQLLEDWAMEPEVLGSYARHWRTGAPLPPDLVARINEAGQFNQGFVTTEYMASAYLDMAWHTLEEPGPVDARAFEAATMARIGLPPSILPRYRTPYFSQSLTGEYAAGYYGYLWSAVLGSDGFEAFKDKGNLFDPGTAKALRTHILEKGGSEDAMELYTRFRGREPTVEPLLRKRGLRETGEAGAAGA